MQACLRFFLNAFRSRNRHEINDSVPNRNFNPSTTQRVPVGSVNSPDREVCARTMNDDNQNNACSDTPVAVTTQPLSSNSPQLNDQVDPVRMMVIALPGPGYSISKIRSCPPLDVANEIEALDSVSTVTDNSDSAWIDQRNEELRYDSLYNGSKDSADG